MKKKRIGFLVIALIAVLGLSLLAFNYPPFYRLGQAGKASSGNPKIVAKVNGKVITEGEVNKKMAWLNILNQGLEKNKQLTRKDALEKLIEEKILLQEAKKQGLSVTLEEAREFAEANRINFDKFPETARKDELKQQLNGLRISEDQYWSEYAPKGYQAAMTIGKLKKKIATGEANTQKANAKWDKYKVQLKQSYKVERF